MYLLSSVIHLKVHVCHQLESLDNKLNRFSSMTAKKNLQFEMFPHGVKEAHCFRTFRGTFRTCSQAFSQLLAAPPIVSFSPIQAVKMRMTATLCIYVCVCMDRKYTILLRAFGECIPLSIFLSFPRVSCHRIRAPHTCCIVSQSFPFGGTRKHGCQSCFANDDFCFRSKTILFLFICDE